MRNRPKVGSAVQDTSPWIARFLLMQLVKLVDRNTKDVTEDCRSASVARGETGHAAMHPLVGAGLSRIYILE